MTALSGLDVSVSSTGLVLIGLILLPLAGTALLLVRPVADRSAALIGVGIGGADLGLALLAAVQTWTRGLDQPARVLDLPWIPALGVRVRLGLDGVSLPLVLLTVTLGLLVCVHLTQVVPPAGRVARLVACVLAVQGAALATFCAQDLLLFFVAFEAVLIPMWFVVAVWGDQDRARVQQFPLAPAPGGPAARAAAAYRFVLYTATGSAVMLLGLLVVAARTGSTDLTRLAGGAGAGLPVRVQVVAAALIVVGLAVKAPMWPLHTWLPAAHTMAPTVGSVLLAGVLLKLGTYGLVRVAVPVLPDGFRALAPALGVLAVLGILWAGLACLVERDLKRLVALSSVAHMGFVLLGVASMTPTGLQGALFANVAHGVLSALLFFVVGAIKDRHHTTDLQVLGGGLAQRLPGLGRMLAFAAIAGLGLPGLAVFWGELLAVAGAWEAAGADGALPGLGRWLAVGAALGTVLASAYWLRVLRSCWQGPPDPRWSPAESGTDEEPTLMGDVTAHERLVLAPLVLATVVLGLLPGPLLGVSAAAVRGLLAGAS